MYKQRSQGFTLIEVIASFTILAMTFMVVLEILSNSSRNTIKSSEQTKLALLAQSKMDEVGITIPVEEGTESGDFEDGITWQIDITPYEAEYEGNTSMDFAPVELFKVQLVIAWVDGLGKNREAIFSTLRAMTPDFDRGPGG
ncbi:type IV pilus modification PilV family protein [Marinicella rhabdoformis]|uniref:type IV pilus modification PilV family protein n=1 Tax=Marinicella rhabdoformis TaxID=2580566 RepID=UPI0015CF9B36|nr:type II secretion system protein [Marinicella rhabdoformis]